jgi:starvation-inducible DNA-binding protein
MANNRTREKITAQPRLHQRAGDGTNDLLVGEVLRTNELQVWFLSEHLVDVPLVKATPSGAA